MKTTRTLTASALLLGLVALSAPAAQASASFEDFAAAETMPTAMWATKADATKKADPSQSGEAAKPDSAKPDKTDKQAKSKPKPKPTPKPGPRDDGDGD